MGAGPMTGGRRGLCGSGAGATNMYATGGVGYGRGMGYRRGFGGGRGRGGGFAGGRDGVAQRYTSGYSPSKSDEMEMLRADAEVMKRSLEAIQGRIAELEKEESA
jgi:hypothetical protein